MPITELPTAPSRSQPAATFVTNADAFVAALALFRTEANALEANVDAKEATATTAAATATTKADEASDSADTATTKAAEAAASALTAVNAPGTSGTSTTSLTVGSGTKSFTTQTGKSWVVGQSVVIPRTSAPTTTRMAGVITAYDSGTGAMEVNVGASGYIGTGTHTDWTIALTASGDNAVSPRRVVQLKVMDDITVVTTGDGKLTFCVPEELNGATLMQAESFVSTVSSSGVPTVQIRNVTGAVDMLTTKATIDVSEFTSYSAATRSVVDAANAVVATGDLIAVDVDIAGTGTKGLGVILSFQL